ncbi:hypothetical protein EVAR_75014_1 [Eumeta japonica]|uniref:Uncharacterized protein n=1 Tax=Eumeta variegata TaxID=151549 RepID=A0A4C1VAS6_EUMVA|nr:hypothetical protein EVAR_75014_1 [Eumeta japonica]
MGVLGPDPPAPGEQGESWSMQAGYGGWSEGLWRVGGRHLVSARSTLKAGGPRSVRVCRSLKGKGQRQGSLQIASLTPLVVECGGAAPRTLDRQGREGRGRRSAQKANSLVRALGAGAR